MNAPREFGPPENAIEIDRSVRFKLGVKRGQSIRERCVELAQRGSGATCGQEQMASIILDDSLAPWDAMCKADAIPGLGLVPPGWKP